MSKETGNNPQDRQNQSASGSNQTQSKGGHQQNQQGNAGSRGNDQSGPSGKNAGGNVTGMQDRERDPKQSGQNERSVTAHSSGDQGQDRNQDKNWNQSDQNKQGGQHEQHRKAS